MTGRPLVPRLCEHLLRRAGVLLLSLLHQAGVMMGVSWAPQPQLRTPGLVGSPDVQLA